MALNTIWLMDEITAISDIFKLQVNNTRVIVTHRVLILEEKQLIGTCPPQLFRKHSLWFINTHKYIFFKQPLTLSLILDVMNADVQMGESGICGKSSAAHLKGC